LLLKYDAEITGAEVIVNGLLIFQQKKIIHEKTNLSPCLWTVLSKIALLQSLEAIFIYCRPDCSFLAAKKFVHIWQFVKAVMTF